MSRRPLWALPLLAVSATLLLSGCESDDDLHRYATEIKARKGIPPEPIPQMKPYEGYAYVPGERRDPFVASLPGGGGNGVRPDLDRAREPLEEFPLDALKLVGAVDYLGKRYAMVRAPDGVIHRVTLGDHMGQNYGKITSVSEAEVRLAEIIPDGFGNFIERPATLAAD